MTPKHPSFSLIEYIPIPYRSIMNAPMSSNNQHISVSAKVYHDYIVTNLFQAPRMRLIPPSLRHQGKLTTLNLMKFEVTRMRRTIEAQDIAFERLSAAAASSAPPARNSVPEPPHVDSTLFAWLVNLFRVATILSELNPGLACSLGGEYEGDEEDEEDDTTSS